MKKIVCAVIIISLVFANFRVNALEVSAKSAILINGDTGEVLFEKNAHQKLPMASTTKIMTALMLCEKGDFEKEITVSAEMLRVEGTSMGLLAGDKVTHRDLLYGLLLSSGNDAANVIAYSLGGTVDGFVSQMNERARELGLENTSFETPSGLDGEQHYTTASDLARLTLFAMKNEEFAKAVSTKSATLCYGNPKYKRTITNHNKLLKIYDGAVGVKTGFTKKSGRCLVSAAKRDGKYVIAVTLCDPNDWQDHKNLLDFGFSKIKTTEITPDNDEYRLPVISSNKEYIKVFVEPFSVNSAETDGFDCQVNLPRFLYAPIEKGEVIGSVVYYKDGKEFHCRDLKAEETLSVLQEKPTFKEKFKENFKDIFKGIWEN